MGTTIALWRGAAALALLAGTPLHAQALAPQDDRPVVRTQDDLPRHLYPVATTAAALLAADDAIFNAFAARAAADADATLAKYRIADAATRRRLLGTRLSYEMLTSRNQAALATVLAIRALEEKPEAKLTSGLREEAILKARIETRAESGPLFEQRFAALYRDALAKLPFAVVGNALKESKGRAEIQSPALLAGFVANEVEPMVAKERAVSDLGADDLLFVRTYNVIHWPLKATTVAALRAVIVANTVEKPDIWAAREVMLTPSDGIRPVTVAVWDSGVDTALFPSQLYQAGAPARGPGNGHGLSFDLDNRPEGGVLRPLTAEQRQAYASVIGDFQGFADTEAAIDSAAADALRAKLATMPASETGPYLQRLRFFGDYIHGTHVAGILARGNPMARIAVIRDTFDTRAVPPPPTEASVARRLAMFRDVSGWLKANRVRVVNMSWIDTPGSYERDLEKNGVGKDAAERKAMARRFFVSARDGFRQLIDDNPGTLFVSAAGNSNADNAFEEGYPSSLVLPNLIIASAVDRAGDETGFTSNGRNVAVSANGYQVRSVVPGGGELAESGTSMAAPNVANLAAKLIALKPELTPVETIALIKAGATPSDDGRRRNINPKASVERLKAATF